MSNTIATLVGSGICCVVPVLAFTAGVYYARYGLPFVVRWRGIARKGDEEEEEA
jgi:hypothetical protein